MPDTITPEHVATTGIWGHSAAIGGKSYVIFCVGQCPYRIAAFQSWAAAHAIPLKPLVGSYKGQSERSFIAPAERFSEVSPWTIDEESVLVLGPSDARDRRPAHLRFSDGRSIDLGALRSVPRDRALAEDSWTYDPLLDAYFICQPS